MSSPTLPSSTWLSLKEAGNAAFKTKEFAAARRAYEQAIAAGIFESSAAAAATAAAPADAASAASPLSAPFDALSHATLESNLSAALFQLGLFDQSAAAGGRAHALHPPMLKAAMRRASALEKMAAQMDNSSAKGETLREAFDAVSKIKSIMSAVPANAAATPLLPAPAEVTATMHRLRASLTAVASALSSPAAFIASLRSGSSAAPAKDVRSLMALVVSSQPAKRDAMQAGLVDVLLQMTIDAASTARVAASRALRHLIGSELSSSAPPAAGTAIDFAPIRAALPALLSILAPTPPHSGPPPLPAVVAAQTAIQCAAALLLSRVAAHPRMEAEVERISLGLVTVLAARKPVAPSGGPPSDVAVIQPSPAQVRVVIAAIESVTFVASSPALSRPSMNLLRSQWLPALLRSKWTRVAHDGLAEGSHQLRSSMLGAVACLTRAAGGGERIAAESEAEKKARAALGPIAKTFGGQQGNGDELSDEQKAALEADGLALRTLALDLFHAPLVRGLLPSAAGGVDLSAEDTGDVMKGLSALLQANSVLGLFVVSYAPKVDDGGDKKPTAAVEVDDDAESKQSSEEHKQKSEADTASTPSSASSPPTQQQARAAPSVLQILLSLACAPVAAQIASPSSPPRGLRTLAAEVLALASSDPQVRAAVVSLTEDEALEARELAEEGLESTMLGRGAGVFLDLLVQYSDANPKNAAVESTPATAAAAVVAPGETIVAHAALALSKLVATGDWATDPRSFPATPDKGAELGAAGEDQPPPVEVRVPPESAQEFALLLHVLLGLLEKHESSVPRFAKDGEDKEPARQSASSGAGGEDDEDESDRLRLSESSRLAGSRALLHLVLESLSYASLHSWAKGWLVASNGGHALAVLVRVAIGPAGAGPVADGPLRYALLHVLHNLTSSFSTFAPSSNTEVEQLKVLASKGLGNSGTSAGVNALSNARQALLAGPDTLVASFLPLLAQSRAPKALEQLFRGYVMASAAAAEGEGTKGASSAASQHAPPIPPALGVIFARTLLQLSTAQSARGMLVQQGAIRLLLDLYSVSARAPSPSNPDAAAAAAVPATDENQSLTSSNSPYRASQDCLSSLARLLISTNPSLLPSSVLASLAAVLLEGLEVSEHELQTFELMMALTNLASTPASDDDTSMADVICTGSKKIRVKDPRAGPSAPQRTNQLNGWSLAKAQLTSNNALVQRAAVELMTNLANAEWVRRKLRGVPAEERAAAGEKVTREEHAASVASVLALPDRDLGDSEDLRLLLAFAQSDDLATARAATGALAMLASSDPLLCARIAVTRLRSFVPIDEPQEEKSEGLNDDDVSAPSLLAPPPAGTRPLLRTGRGIILRLASDPDTPPDVKLRVDVIQREMEQAERQRKK